MSVSDADSIGGEFLNEKLEMKSEYQLLTKDLMPKIDGTKLSSLDYSLKDLSKKRKREEPNKVYDINKCHFIDFIDAVEDDTMLDSKSILTQDIEEPEVIANLTIEEENKAINIFQNLFSKTLKIEMSGLKIKQVIDLDINTILDWKLQENIKKCR